MIFEPYILGCNEKLVKRENIITMTNEQKYKIQKVVELATDTLNNYQNTDPKIISVWLSVAGDYCNEVAKEIGEKKL